MDISFGPLIGRFKIMKNACYLHSNTGYYEMFLRFNAITEELMFTV
jgi:hypothetical protein